MHTLRWFKIQTYQLKEIGLADICSSKFTYILMIPWPTTFGTLSEVNHWEVFSCNLFSTFLYPIQMVKLGIQPTYIHDNWMASFYGITWYFSCFSQKLQNNDLYIVLLESLILRIKKHFLNYRFEKFIRNRAFVWCLPSLFRL